MASAEFDALFRQTRREVDDVLAEVPQSLLEARRLVTREMQFEPRAEELQAIVKIAGFMSTSMACYELPRQMLALRVIAERELAELGGSRRLSAERLGQSVEIIEDLLDAAGQSHADVTANEEVMAELSDDERNYLLQVSDVMDLPRERLEAATILAPRLELVAKQVTTGNISETFPGLSDDEIEMFNRAVHLEDDAAEGPARVCLDAMALRTIFEEYIAVWERSGYLDDAGLVRELQQGIREQLRETETAYRVVSAHLQEQQAEAISANLEDFADQIRAATSRLFEVYVETQPLMREPREDDENAAPRRSLAQTLAEAETADENAVDHRKRSEELYLNALEGLRRDRAAGRDMSNHPLEVARRDYRRRLWIMAATVAVLSIVAVAVHLFMPDPAPDPVAVSLKEFQPAFSVIDAKPIGSMLYVRVTDWDDLNAQSIRFRTGEIGELASMKGLSLAYVVNDRGQALAEWHANGGVLIKSREADSGPVDPQQARRPGGPPRLTGN